MFFKKHLVLPFICLLMTSCSWWGEGKREAKELVISKNEIFGIDPSCVNNAGDFFSEYFNGRSSSKEITDMEFCVQKTMENMFKFAYPEDEEGFTRESVQEILSSLDQETSKSEVNQNAELMFIVKRMILGGEKDRFTKNEWVIFDENLKEIKQILISARESAEYIFFSEGGGLTQKEKMYDINRKAFDDLDQLRIRLGGELDISELNWFIEYILSGESLKPYSKVSLIGAQLLFSSDELYSKNQSESFRRLGVVFEIIGRVRELNFKNGFMVGDSVLDLMEVLKLIYINMSKWSKQDKGYAVSIKNITTFVEELYNADIFEGLISNIKPVNETLELVLAKVFKEDSLTSSSFKIIETHFKAWISGQTKLIKQFNFPWAKKLIPYFADNIIEEGFSQSLIDEVVEFKEPVFIQSHTGAITNLYKEKALYSQEKYFDLSFKFVLMSLSVPIMKAYNSTERYELNEVANVFLKQSGLEQLFLDFRPIGLEAGFSDPYSCEAAKRVFAEANSLTFNGNGDDKISVQETAEWLGTMLSVSSVSKHVYSRINTSCEYGGMESFGYQYQKRSCFKEGLFSRSSVFVDFFPGLSGYLNILGSESLRKDFIGKISDWVSYPIDFEEVRQENFESNILETLRSCKHEGFPISRSEFNESTALVIYVENLFHKFDKTGLQNWLFQDSEGPDMILDGGEISNFLKAKFTSNIPAVIEAFQKDNWLADKFSTSWLKRRIFSLPESAIKLDRSKLLDLLKIILGKVKIEAHTYKKQYCDSVNSSSLTGIINYDSSKKISCVSGEKMTLDHSKNSK